MVYYLAKVVITMALIIAISEISTRISFEGAIMASIPVVSVLAMLWLYADTKDVSKVGDLSSSIFWLVLPSLLLLIALPIFLKLGWNFYLSMSLAIGLTVLACGLMITVLKHYGIDV